MHFKRLPPEYEKLVKKNFIIIVKENHKKVANLKIIETKKGSRIHGRSEIKGKKKKKEKNI